MLQDNPWLAALIFIVMIVGANGLMYIVARGASRDKKSGGLFQALSKATKNPWGKEDKSLEELRQRVKDLNDSAPKDGENGERRS